MLDGLDIREAPWQDGGKERAIGPCDGFHTSKHRAPTPLEISWTPRALALKIAARRPGSHEFRGVGGSRPCPTTLDFQVSSGHMILKKAVAWGKRKVRFESSRARYMGVSRNQGPPI